jgi:hypothetical protein
MPVTVGPPAGASEATIGKCGDMMHIFAERRLQ